MKNEAIYQDYQAAKAAASEVRSSLARTRLEVTTKFGPALEKLGVEDWEVLVELLNRVELAINGKMDEAYGVTLNRL